MQRAIMAGCLRDLRVLLITLALAVLPSITSRSQIFRTLYNLTGLNDGRDLHSGVILIGNTLYGTASYGGGSRYGGTVYAINTDGTGFRVVFAFPGDENDPIGAFVISGGILYTTGNEPNGATGFGGSIIEVPIDGSSNFPINWYDFAPAFGDGVGPDGLIMSGNLIFGVTQSGGQFGQGTIYDYDGSIVTNLYSFRGSDGANPNGSLVLYDGTFYGVTFSGGNSGNGTVYTMNTDGSGFRILHHFTGSANGEGANPMAGLILWGDTLFGSTSSGGASSNGTVFSIGTNGTGFTTLHSFDGRDGAKPAAGLNFSGNTLYGTTMDGGSSNWGTVFAVSIDGSGFTTLHSFNGTDGACPLSKMLLVGDTLYGTTSGNAGITSYGTVFSLMLGVAPHS